MKRTHEAQEELLYITCIPDEILATILAFRYPLIGKQLDNTRSIFKLRQSSTRLCHTIDQHLLRNVVKLGPRVMRFISDEAIILFTGITALRLKGGSRITDAGLQKMTRLHKLSLMNNSRITDASLMSLSQLRELAIFDNPGDIDGSGFSALTSLTTLNIVGNDIITEDCLSSLCSLTSLNVESDELITSEGLAPLRESLRFINIMGNENLQLSDLASLTRLEIVYTNFAQDDKGMAALVKNGVEVVQGCIRGSFLSS